MRARIEAKLKELEKLTGDDGKNGKLDDVGTDKKGYC
jgi:hypothetical protein